MTRDGSILAQVCGRLDEAGARYVLVGGRAVQLWGRRRPARDIEILVDATVENLGRVLAALEQAGVELARPWLAPELAGRRVTVLGGCPRVTILTEITDLRYPEAAGEAVTKPLSGLGIPTASLRHLIVILKAGLASDAEDAVALERMGPSRNP